MKLLNLALLSTAALISTVKATSILDSLYQTGLYLVNNYDDSDLWGGFVLGLQYDTTDTAHECYTSYESFVTDISSLSTYITNIITAPTVAADNSIIYYLTDNPYFVPSVYIKLVKRLSESGSVFFVFYK